MLPVLLCCKGKKESEESGSFPVLAIIQSQVKQVDTSLTAIKRIVTIDSTADTTYLKREEFRNLAADFLTLPDITQKNLKNRYVETRMYDNALKSVVLDYSPKDTSLEIQREIVTIDPEKGADTTAGNQVKEIYISQVLRKGNSTVEKKLFWVMNSHFQVVEITQEGNGPEKVKKTEVIWNNFDAPNR